MIRKINFDEQENEPHPRNVGIEEHKVRWKTYTAIQVSNIL
ncbi:hypothetical protein ACEYW6_25700 [Nostoc sp. UIC 10607]